MLSVLRTLTMALLVFALLVSVSVNVYYYSTAASLNDSLRSQIGYSPRSSESSPLYALEISRTQGFVDEVVKEARKIQSENLQLRSTLTQVRNELSNAQRSGGGLDVLSVIMKVLTGF